MSVWHRFRHQVALRPDAPALWQSDRTWTYAELAAEAEELAGSLAGVAVEGNVVCSVVCTVHGAVLGLLGASAAGTTLLPLAADESATRFGFVLDDSGAVALLTEDPETGALKVAPVAEGKAQGSVPAGSAYLMYTSGSTGQPKAVIVSQGALLDRLDGLSQVPGLREGESMLALTAFTFDICLAELLLPLTVGGTVIAASAEARQQPDAFAADLERHRPDVTQATPSFWKFAIAGGWLGTGARRLWCGGEAMTPALARDLLSRCEELWNVYGPTEATIWATADRVSDPNRIRLGPALPGSDLHLVDPNGAVLPVAAGVTGEIVLSGNGIATGYLNRPDLTAASFDALPGLPTNHYRTGDFGRWAADGGLEFLGRRDGQVKLRGHRIELGEVEAALESHSEVSEAVVLLARGDDPIRAHLVAVVVTTSPVARLRAWLASRLPTVMIPRRTVTRPALPRTPAGKVDRTTLARELGL
ncbi:amino acid adenylation domain-containing protein [Micromonospora sp. NPDC049051]|uniref:amino acid adenylation domain-containing protein n=1 Tax=Micromonospora sp. NPDC049051 TaxID=3364264 RepID=UPI003718E162